jgi:hypothetical protein
MLQELSKGHNAMLGVLNGKKHFWIEVGPACLNPCNRAWDAC